MNRYGLYVVDDTKSLKMEGYDGSDRVDPWRRAKLKYNGGFAGRVTNEKNVNLTFNKPLSGNSPLYFPTGVSQFSVPIRYGLYAKAGKLVLNGETVHEGDDNADNTTDDELVETKIRCTDDKVTFDNIPFKTFTECINITKSDYIDLRSGLEVEGYAKYNPSTPYNIVANVSQASTVYFESEFEQTDIIYNSYNNSLSENTVNNNTFLSVYPPTLAIRPFNPIINKGEGLVLKYFVDTRDYDSVHITKQGSETTPRIHLNDTFTVIVRDSIGRILHKATHYAGEFVVRLKPFKVLPDGVGYDETNVYDSEDDNLVGETTFSVQCIDSEHRGSVERFFDVVVNDTPAKKWYEMDEDDLDNYGITPNTGRYNFVAGYKNLIGFRDLIKDVADTNEFCGIKVFNPTTLETDENGKTKLTNYTYYIDHHPKIDGTDKDPVIYTVNDYYLIYYDASENKLYAVTELGNVEIQEAVIDNFANCKILKKTSFKVNDKTVKVTEDPIEWILHDGAELYRNNIPISNTENEICVGWGVEPTSGTKEHYYTDNDGIDRLRTYILNNIIKASQCKTDGTIIDGKHANNPSGYLPKTGYYYCVYVNKYVAKTDKNNPGKFANVKSEEYIHFPNNFILDLNYTTIRVTDSTDLHTFPATFALAANVNTHIINGRVQGVYDYDGNDYNDSNYTDAARWARDKTLKIGVLRQGVGSYNDVFQAAPSITMNACRCCSIENVENTGGGGYEDSFGYGIGDKGVSSDGRICINWNWVRDGVNRNDTRLMFSNLGFITYDSEQDSYSINTNDIIDTINPVDENDEPYYENYDPTQTGVGKVKLAYSDDYFPIVTNEDYYLGSVNAANEHGNLKLGYYIKRYADAAKELLDDGTMFIMAGLTDAVKSGAYPEVFVYFYNYDEDNDKYTLIRIVKTTYWAMLKAPRNATHIKLVGYSWYIDNTINKLSYVGVSNTRPTSSCFFKNCTIKHSRSIGANGVGINVGFDNCYFDDIQDTLDGLYVTPQLCDIEENRRTGYLFYFTNCYCRSYRNIQGRHNAQSVVNAGCYNVHLENCIGLGYEGALRDNVIRNCEMSKLCIDNLARTISRYEGIVDGVFVHMIKAAENYLHYATTHKKKTEVTNPCVEAVTKHIVLNDFFAVITPANQHIQLELFPGDMRIVTGVKSTYDSHTYLYGRYVNNMYNKKTMIQEQTIE